MRSWREAKTWARFLVALPVAVFPAVAATLVVDDGGGTPYATIQSAIDAAVPGQDDVFVRCGLYHENLEMRDGVSVAGEGASCTTVDGGRNGSVVRLIGVGAGTVIQGFTLMNGESGLGGGLYVEAGSPTITGNVIEGNSAVDVAPLTGYGGGIHISPTVTFRGPTAPVVTGNVISGNTADKFGGRIEVYGGEGSVISNNVIAGNSATQGGGGIDVFAAFPAIFNNTIVRNCVQGAQPACSSGGGGIALTDSGVMDVANNIVAWNEAAAGAGGIDVIGSTLLLTANDVTGNLPVNYAGVSDPTGTNGNISAAPRFVDERPSFLGFQLRSDSAGVDAAAASFGSPPDTIVRPAPVADIGGIPRPVDGDADGTGSPDMGARENAGATRLSVGPLGEVSWDASVDPGAAFNLYRGDLDVLRTTAVFVQDPAVEPNAARWCDLASPSLADGATPPAGEGYFYLAVIHGAVEGTLGFDSSVTERPSVAANACP